jgi:tRNA (guanine37-N1)-methyltransferase
MAEPGPGPSDAVGVPDAARPAAPAMLRVDVLTIFPDLVASYVDASVLGRARQRGVLDVRVHDLRSAATDPHRSVDDAPFGGGAGMVLMAPPIFGTVESAKPPRPLFLLDPAGRRFDQDVAGELASLGSFSLLCGRYEGVDERVRQHLIDGELSIGDVVLAGGELAALVVIEATARLVPGVLGNAASNVEESFSDGLLEYPHYTRPASFRGWRVPDVLLSGDHERIRRWRRAQALARTRRWRPDLIAAAGGLSAADRALLSELGEDPGVDAPTVDSPEVDSAPTDGADGRTPDDADGAERPS